VVQGSCSPTEHAITSAPLLDLLRSFLTSHAPALPASEIEWVAQAFHPLPPDRSAHQLLANSLPSEGRRALETRAASGARIFFTTWFLVAHYCP
jgi:hypothetical protein